ncbi:endonuclease/exonuclease/phosphatase family protein [Methylovulum miyakonense]|uniref:endonuclease/exonuclease/phosphatase family protein n=1 Tax=Methylovulum miyakonense TaxID=645578 RepID=UPI000381985D|nr:endonuclease/exonuclease/phosphatase family protein [Methylovulum miyakonense]
MVTFLFWNVGRTRRLDIVCRLVREFDVDVLMLAENTLGIADILAKLNTPEVSDFHYNSGLCERIAIFSKFQDRQIKPQFESKHISIRHFKPQNGTDLSLVVAHLPSKLRQSNDSQAFEMAAIARDIIRMEEKVGHQRTVLVGDLNMNPFETGLIAANGLHATMARHIAEKKTRMVNGRSYPFFYNPMWSLLGDASNRPSGSYYHQQSEHVSYFWHLFDQVLLRSDVLPMFQNENLKLIDRAGDCSLLTRNGIPDKNISDHLPILFQLNC